MTHLRSVLRLAAWLAVAAATLGLWACGCPPDTDEIFLLRTPDSATQTLIDRCLAPALQDCLPLCQHLVGVMANKGIVHCEIHPQTGAYVEVHVGIANFCPGGE